MRPNKVTVLMLVVGLAGCRSSSSAPSEKSQIVQEVETAGAGDLTTVNRPQLLAWFESHKDIALKIDPQCRTAGKRAEAEEAAKPGSPRWAQTVEGVVCHTEFSVTNKDPYSAY